MSSSKYDYSPLSTNIISRQRKNWVWPACFVALLLINIAVVHFASRVPLTSLDNFQGLNGGPIVNASLAPPFNPDEHAVVTSLYTDAYTTAVTTLGHSLQHHNTTVRKILIYIPGRLSDHTKCLTTAAGWTLHPVPYIPPPHNGKGIASRFKDQYTKLNIWSLDALGIKSLVYIDADTLVLQNFDELFTLPFNFAAVPDVFGDKRGYTIGFNAGVMFLRPSTAVFKDMLSKLEIAQYPPGLAEQAFLNAYFGAQAVRLPYIYNGNLAIKRRTPALWDVLIPNMRIVHYTLVKPFRIYGPPQSPEEFESFLHESRNAEGGIFDEAIGWWEKVWKDLLAVRQASLEQCQ